MDFLILVADGQPKAIVVPVSNGDASATYEAYVRGRSMLAASRLRRTLRAAGKRKMSLRAIDQLIRATRAMRETKR